MSNTNRFAVSLLSKSNIAKAYPEEVLIDKKTGEVGVVDGNGVYTSYASRTRDESIKTQMCSFIESHFGVTGKVYQILDEANRNVEFGFSSQREEDVVNETTIKIRCDFIDTIPIDGGLSERGIYHISDPIIIFTYADFMYVGTPRQDKLGFVEDRMSGWSRGEMTGTDIAVIPKLQIISNINPYNESRGEYIGNYYEKNSLHGPYIKDNAGSDKKIKIDNIAYSASREDIETGISKHILCGMYVFVGRSSLPASKFL